MLLCELERVDCCRRAACAMERGGDDEVVCGVALDRAGWVEGGGNWEVPHGRRTESGMTRIKC